MRDAKTTTRAIRWARGYDLRQEAEDFLLSNWCGLADLLQARAGEEGLALGFALRELILDTDTDPGCWPLVAVALILPDIQASTDPSLSRPADVRQRLVALQAARWDVTGPTIWLRRAEMRPDPARSPADRRLRATQARTALRT